MGFINVAHNVGFKITSACCERFFVVHPLLSPISAKILPPKRASIQIMRNLPHQLTLLQVKRLGRSGTFSRSAFDS